MKIVVLDRVPLDEGDMDWSAYHQLGDVFFYDRTSADELLERAQGAEVLCTNKVVLDKKILKQLPKLKFIQVMATGTNVIDIKQAQAQGVKVANIPSYSTASVLQHTFALLFQMFRDVAGHSQGVRAGRWASCPDFSYFHQTLHDLEGLHWGVVGQGEIGRAVAKVAEGFGARVSFAQVPGRPAAADKIPLDELLPSLDVLSLHCPLSDLTEGLMNEARFRLLPHRAFFVNVARGPVVVERDLAKVLNEGHLAGAATDVLSVEPPASDNPLLSADRCLITPHVAWGSKTARQRLISIMVENLAAFQSGQIKNIIFV